MRTPRPVITASSPNLSRALSEARSDFARALRFATDAVRGLERPEVIVVSDGNVGEAADASGAVRLGDARLVYVPIGKGKRNVAITQFSVRRYPLDKSRYEVMLEVTNTGADPEDVELTLFGDGTLVDSAERLVLGEQGLAEDVRVVGRGASHDRLQGFGDAVSVVTRQGRNDVAHRR